MPDRGGPVHVATTKRVHKGKAYYTHLLRRTYREGGKVKHQTLGNISHLPPQVIDIIRGALKGQTYLPASEAFEVVRSLPHGHVAAVLGTWRKLEMDRLISTSPSRVRDMVTAMVISRIIDPTSKLATCRGLKEQTRLSTLGEALCVEGIDEDDLYEAMDWLVGEQPRIEGELAKRHLADGCLVLYDVTSTYYTGNHCSLAKFGHSRDRKKGFPQILIGLLCTKEGCPVAVEVFDGNRGDPKTLGSQIAKIQGRFGIKRVVMVGDRGMITQARIDKELSRVEGWDWITVLRAVEVGSIVREGEMQLSLFDERDLVEITSSRYPRERLIACRNPLLAKERARKREALLEATGKDLEKIALATRREKRQLKGEAAIGLRVGKVIDRYKVGKHFKVEIGEEGLHYERDEAKIAGEAALDGIYIVRTSVPQEAMSAEEAVGAYKSLSMVEQAFRSLKSVDLKVRPIYHRLADRVRAHVFICMLAYYVEWHMRQALSPLIFGEEDKADRKRESIVCAAERSDKAKAKAQTKRTQEGYPVHSFHTLLRDLATIAKNSIQPKGSVSDDADKKPTFDLLTTPTPLQRRAFELLGVPLKV